MSDELDYGFAAAMINHARICEECAPCIGHYCDTAEVILRNAAKMPPAPAPVGVREYIGKDGRSHFRVTDGNCACGWTIINEFEWQQHLRREEVAAQSAPEAKGGQDCHLGLALPIIKGVRDGIGPNMQYDSARVMLDGAIRHLEQMRAAAPQREGEETFREDERQACWEDFMHVMEQCIADKTKLKDLYKSVLENGWKQLGTGDGKPMHRRDTSFVSRWLAERAALASTRGAT